MKSRIPAGYARNFILLFVLLGAFAGARAQTAGGVGGTGPVGTPANAMPPDLSNIGIDQKLNAQLPLNLPFRDETGQTVTLQKYFRNRPVILSLVYFNCPMLCSQVLSGMTSTMKLMKLSPGSDYQVLTVSFDPKDTPKAAAADKAQWLERLAKPGAKQAWHFLTGDQDSISKLTAAAGFRYRWDPRSQQFFHATAIMVLTPEGRLSKYFYGVQYSPTDMRFGLVQASDHKIGSAVDAILLFCCRYNAVTGKYDLLVSRVVFLAGIVTLVVLGSLLLFLFRYGKAKGQPARTEAIAK